jgi:CheY-like chemotaxis protein
MTDEHAPRLPRVLIVDDELEIINALESALNHYAAPFTREYAMTGIGAIELVRIKCFGLVLLDIDLPDLTGGAAYQIRKLDPHLPIVLFSNHNEEVADPIKALVPDVLFLLKADWMGRPQELIAKIVELIGDRTCDDEALHRSEQPYAGQDRTVPKSLPLPSELEDGARRFLTAKGYQL